MSEFRFANHYWIHALWIVLVVALVLIVLQLRGRAILDQLVSRWMQLRLVHRTSLLRRIVAIAFATFAMILLVFALMRPQWGMTLQQSVRVDTQIMVCLDVSKSMLAEDVAPNRLERAKVELDSLLGLMGDGQQVGLIAFAGKAAVLCPMTTDFGFLRLVLNDAEPESVGVGGTKLGEAIQKALRGFGESGDINRLILLITDGEDHDSFPLEAAKQAKEKGVRIVSIGFGDEAGSKIEVTDPRTGARTFLKDRAGNAVDSRLDGEMLREIVKQTDGVYIPAGTGALDLESIYRTHIATLMKGNLDTERRVVRNEAFQWFVLAAIVLMMLALLIATPINLKWRALTAAQEVTAAPPVRAAVLLLAAALAATSPVALAQQPAGPAAPSAAKPAPAVAPGDAVPAPQVPSPTAPSSAEAGTTGTQKEETIDASLPPRSVYNQALSLVRSDPDRAERLLNRARSEAGSDGELRYRTLYNLGWVEVQRADNLLQNEPQQALQHLQQAANRFRESIRVRPESDEARQNLELVSRRILELTDSLRQQDPRDLATRLDELITQLREHQGELQGMVQLAAGRDKDAPVETYRDEYRRLAVTQRQLISDSQRFTDDARAEQDAAAKKQEDKKTAEDKLRVVQLGNMLNYIDSGIQRMNSARSLTRRLQGEEAFRRWSSALSDLKRARDQLRNPVEVLGQIIPDALETAQLTQTLATNKLALPDDPSHDEIPAWLNSDYLQQQHDTITQRIAELEQVFAGITAAQQENAAPADAEAEQQNLDPNTQQLLQNIEAATPLVQAANESFAAGGEELKKNALEAAHRRQMDGITSLSNAWELFFDLRRLIELVYHDQQVAQRVMRETDSKPEVARQMIAPLDEAQQKNLARCGRLSKLLQLEQAQLADSASAGAAEQPPGGAPLGPPAPDAQDQQQTAARRQQLELAAQLLGEVVAKLQQSREILKSVPPTAAAAAPPETPAPAEPGVSEPAAQPPAEPVEASTAPAGTTTPTPPPAEATAAGDSVKLTGPLAEVALEVDQALKHLEELRRLFFSLVEHLRDTAQRQADLNDQTTKLSADPAAVSQPQRSGPLALRQQQLHDIAQQIAEALGQQSQQAAAAADQSSPDPDAQGQADPQQAAQAAEKLGKAAELVGAAQKSMQTAQQELSTIAEGQATADEKPFAAAQEHQHDSLAKLLEALALLDENQPPPPEQGQDQQQQPQDQQQDQQQQQQQQQMNANQLLQLIRDREAERRKDKKQKEVSSSGAVDKDW